MDRVESSGNEIWTPRIALDVKRKRKKRRKAQPDDVNELTNLLFLSFVFIISWKFCLCSSKRFRFALVALKRGTV